VWDEKTVNNGDGTGGVKDDIKCINSIKHPRNGCKIGN